MRAAALTRTEDLVVTWGRQQIRSSLPLIHVQLALPVRPKRRDLDVSMSICFLFFVFFYRDFLYGDCAGSSNNFVRRCSKVSARFATALAIWAHFSVLVKGWQSVAIFTFMPSAPTSPLLACRQKLRGGWEKNAQKSRNSRAQSGGGVGAEGMMTKGTNWWSPGTK